MTSYIQGPAKGKAKFIQKQGGILLEVVPTRLAPKGAHICVVDNGAFEAAAVVDSEQDLTHFNALGDDRPKEWLHVDADLLKKLLYEGDSV